MRDKDALPKTNAARALDALEIPYELRAYDVDEADLSAVTVAAKVGLPVEQVYKTLCLRADDKRIVLCILAADAELDLKAAARLAGVKGLTPVAVKELPGLTGYIRGGVTALACKKPYPVFVDEWMVLHEVVSVSAGQRGLQLLLDPADYVRATEATVGPISRSA